MMCGPLFTDFYERPVPGKRAVPAG